jgi:DNA replication initiation complex subunit (GINS family)
MTEFSLDELVKAHREEKTSRDLVELPEDFYQRTAGYVSQLISELKHGDALRQELLREELRNIVIMVQEIHLTRVLKAIDKVTQGHLPNHLIERERYAFSEIKQNLEKLQTDLVYPAISGKVTGAAPLNITNVLLMMLTDVPEKIIGADMRNYGPFVKGEIISLPAQNAEIMIRHGAARKIAVRL